MARARARTQPDSRCSDRRAPVLEQHGSRGAIDGASTLAARRLLQIILALAFWATAVPSAAQTRQALVIGVGDYAELARLASPADDVDAVAGALRANGFEVEALHDPTAKALRKAIGDFSAGLQAGGVGLVYYVGYTSTVDGRDYLLAADAAPEAARGVDPGANLAVVALLGALQRSSAAHAALVFNAHSPAQQDGASAERGPEDVLQGGPYSRLATLYASGPPAAAADAPKGQSLFAETFVRALEGKAPTARRVFDDTAAELTRVTVGGRTVWYRMAPGLDFALGRSPPPQPAVAAKPSPQRPDPAPSPTEQVAPERGTTGVAGATPLPGATPMPRFPWPPPKPAAFGVIPRGLIQAPGVKIETLGAVADRIDSALIASGYAERSFHAAPNGFAMVTRLERIRPDGRPDPDRRWLGAAEATEFSLERYLTALFFGDPGRYRLIVFVVTDQTFAATGKPLTSEEGDKLLTGGYVTLPSRFDALPFTARHDVTALVYEFEKPEGGEVRRVERSRLSALDHLNGADLIDALRRR